MSDEEGKEIPFTSLRSCPAAYLKGKKNEKKAGPSLRSDIFFLLGANSKEKSTTKKTKRIKGKTRFKTGPQEEKRKR